MYELTGKLQSVAVDVFTNKATITFTVNELEEARALFQNLKECEKLKLKVDQYRQKRSLNANSYFWVLVDKLSVKMGIPKEKIYRDAIRDIGGNSSIVCTPNKAVKKLCDSWAKNGLGWQTDTMPSKLDGCTNVILYYGSSTYDTKQMSLLIDNIVQDCKAVGIETLSEKDLALLKANWGAVK